MNFLHQDEIVEKVKGVIEAELLDSNSTRIFYKQMKLPGVSEEENISDADSQHNKTIHPKDLVRTDHKEQKLDKYFQMQIMDSSTISNSSNDKRVEKDTLNCSQAPTLITSNKNTIKRHNKSHKNFTKLTSVITACNKIEKDCSTTLRKIIKDLVFVGVVDENFSLFQFETKLYMVHTIHLRLAKYFFLI